MRPWWCLLLVVPLAVGQPLLDDPPGDQDITLAGGDAPFERWGALDLRSLSLVEEPERFAFELAAEDLDPPGENMANIDHILYHVLFGYREADYRVEIRRFAQAPYDDALYWAAWLGIHDAGADRWAHVEDVDLAVDLEADTLAFALPRARLVGADGTPAQRDAPITDIRVSSSLRFNNSTLLNTPAGRVDYPVGGSDRMPDTGAARWLIQHGLTQSGHAFLASAAPVRVSNGEATTFLFELDAQNDGDAKELFAFSAKEVPPSWTVTFPQQRVRIDAGQTVKVPVLVSVPFQHEHGKYQPLLVEMQSQHDPGSTGRVELGVRYTAVPQPSGHHDTVFVHTDSEGSPYMNTVENHPGATGEPAQARSGCACSGRSIQRFHVPLLPGLQMGLDMDMQGAGTAELAISINMPASDVEVRGWISVDPPGEDANSFFQERPNDVAVLTPVTGLTFEKDTPQTISTAIQPLDRGDYLPFTPDAAMVLTLDVSAPGDPGICCLIGIEASVHGGSMRLPLSEYHDDVDEYFSTLTGIELYAAGPQQRDVNPGKTVVFNVTAENIGQETGTYALSLTGSHPEWARVLGSQSVQIPAGGTRQLAVAVSVPEGVAHGERADITLHAQHRGDENVRTLIRLLAQVDTSRDAPDESALADELDGRLQDKRSPWAGTLLVLAVLAGLAARRGPRR